MFIKYFKSNRNKLHEQYNNWHESPLGTAYENITEQDILYDFLSDKENGIKHKQWNLIPANQYRNLLKRYMQLGDSARIPDNVMDEWIELICNNLVTLRFMTDFAGHSSFFPFDAVDDVFGDKDENLFTDYEDMDRSYDVYSDFLERIGYYDWAQLPDGSDAISDYGIEPLERILEELTPSSTPEEKLLIINRCLDVVHWRGDLASLFIEGGKSTCSKISNESVFIPPHIKLDEQIRTQRKYYILKQKRRRI